MDADTLDAGVNRPLGRSKTEEQHDGRPSSADGDAKRPKRELNPVANIADAQNDNETSMSPTWAPLASQTLRDTINATLSTSWIVTGAPLTTLRDADDFCDLSVVNGVIDAKGIFDTLNPNNIREARKRANPYEEIMSAIFQNRAAMKTANLDCVLDWSLSGETDDSKRQQKNPSLDLSAERQNASRDADLYYFADICAGPGGFSEYMIWRKAFYNTKGFGFTLRGHDDFKLQQFRAGSAAYLETFYGDNNDGDVTDPKNLISLENYVKRRTNGVGCHLVMADGGFSVQGKEEIQEVLSKRLYLCQFIVGLSLARVGDGESRKGGNFLCKLFDVFTPFTAGLIYLMYSAYERISLHKPHSSRPANSERYIYCEKLTSFGATTIKGYLSHINVKLDELRRESGDDVVEIYPPELIRQDEQFYAWYKSHIESFAERQIKYLNKYREFAKDKTVFDETQTGLRERYLRLWEIPTVARVRDELEVDKPASAVLRDMLRGQTFSLNKSLAFSLDGDAWREGDSQIRLKELYAVVCPQYTEPTLLFTNNRGQAYIYRSETAIDELSNLHLPPRTLLLVQVTRVYSEQNNHLTADHTFSTLIFVVDAALLSGDDISNLEYSHRLQATQKFCQAANRGVESFRAEQLRLDVKNRRRKGGAQLYQRLTGWCPPFKSDYYHLHCAEALDLVDLPAHLASYRIAFHVDSFLPLAVRDYVFPADVVPTQDALLWPCQSVRFVQRFKAGHRCYWSEETRRLLLVDADGTAAATTTASASFFDQLPPTRPPLVWTWSWKPDGATNHSPMNIIKDEHNDSLLTRWTLREAIDTRNRSYPSDALNAQIDPHF